MGLKPDFKILVNGADITPAIRARLVSMRIKDQAGLKSDTLEIVLADQKGITPVLDIPTTGVIIHPMIGYDGIVYPCGSYTVDEVILSGPPDTLTIRAKAAPQDGDKKTIKSQKTRSWDKGTTIGDMVSTIAGEHGLEPAVAESLAGIALPHTDQVNESDLNLLTRIAGDYNAVTKPANGNLIFAKRGEEKSIAGLVLDAVVVRQTEASSWTFTQQKRSDVGTVVASYRDLATASDKEAKAGDGEPVIRLKKRYADAESAQEAADAEFKKRKRSGQRLSIRCVGKPTAAAEAPLIVEGFRYGTLPRWIITDVTHTISASGGFTTSIEAELPDE